MPLAGLMVDLPTTRASPPDAPCDAPLSQAVALSAKAQQGDDAALDDDEMWQGGRQAAAMCGSLCLTGEAVALLCSLARQGNIFPTSPGPDSRGGQTSSSPGPRSGSLLQQATTAAHLQQARASSPQHTFTYASLKSMRNHMSTRAGMCVCAVIALAYSKVELDQHLRSGAGATMVQQLWRLKEWEEAREDGGNAELGEFEGKRCLTVALANFGLRCRGKSASSPV
jgi:hypothetical protein